MSDIIDYLREGVLKLREGRSCTRVELIYSFGQATDLIKQQQQQIAELEALVPKWISVDERLPDTCAYGLYGTLVDISDIVVTNQGAAVFFDGYWCEVGWDSHDLGKRIQGVTHWMPLLQPPKGEKQ